MPTTTTFQPGNQAVETLDGVDRHFYEKQIGPASPFDDTYAFRLAAARAKDTARHKLINRIRQEERKARANRSIGAEIGDIVSGHEGDARAFLESERRDIIARRTIDGVEGAPDDAIKL